MAQTSLQVIISAKDQFTGTANKVVGSLNRIDSAAGRVGRGTGQLATGFARVGVVAGVAAAGGLTYVAKKTIDWESALAGVNKTMDLTSGELSDIGTDIRKLATTIPLSATEIAGLVEQAGALGIAKEDVLAFAEATAAIGVTTNVSAEQAASSLGVLSNLLGLQGVEFERFGSALVDLGNKGASTEDAILEIAQRASGAAATIGISADELLGWSSAIANIGMQPDAAGTAFQTFALDVQKFTRSGGSELKTLAKVAGTTTKEFKKAFEKDASGALESFIDGLGKLDKGERADVLESLGIGEARMRRMLLGLAEAERNTDNVSKSLQISADAWTSNTAAAEEADKRYGTVASKLQLLNNQFIEGALLIGEGFLPALGRVADKLKAALGDEGTRNDLRKLGEDLGAAIDEIDWNAVVKGAREFASLLKTALGISKSIFDVVNRMPTELKAAAASFLILNKASGGLLGAGIGNIAGGLGQALARSFAANLPGIGKAFVQPVFVTNMPVGGLGGGLPGAVGTGGGAAAAAGASGLAAGGGVLVAGAVAAAVGGVIIADQMFGTENRRFESKGLNAAEVAAIRYYSASAADQATMAKRMGEIPSKADWKSAIAKLDGQPAGRNASGGPDDRGGRSGKDSREDKTPKAIRLLEPRLERVRRAQVETRRETGTGLARARAAVRQAERASRDAGRHGANATRTAQSGISATIRANRPIVTTNVYVTNNAVVRSQVVQERYGAGKGSRDRNHPGPT